VVLPRTTKKKKKEREYIQIEHFVKKSPLSEGKDKPKTMCQDIKETQ
jgi:hypothetical protein